MTHVIEGAEEVTEMRRKEIRNAMLIICGTAMLVLGTLYIVFALQPEESEDNVVGLSITGKVTKVGIYDKLFSNDHIAIVTVEIGDDSASITVDMTPEMEAAYRTLKKLARGQVMLKLGNSVDLNE